MLDKSNDIENLVIAWKKAAINFNPFYSFSSIEEGYAKADFTKLLASKTPNQIHEVMVWAWSDPHLAKLLSKGTRRLLFDWNQVSTAYFSNLKRKDKKKDKKDVARRVVPGVEETRDMLDKTVPF